jgi:hypothetical protein
VVGVVDKDGMEVTVMMADLPRLSGQTSMGDQFAFVMTIGLCDHQHHREAASRIVTAMLEVAETSTIVVLGVGVDRHLHMATETVPDIAREV